MEAARRLRLRDLQPNARGALRFRHRGAWPRVAEQHPEEAFVAAISQCHMLWFLHLALEAKLVVDRYVDEAIGVLDRTWMSKVTLRPRVTFSSRAPTDEEHRALHHKAHEKCFIANSIKSEVTVEPGIDQR
jgi:organic hydroperoxide reductase OsmC/OhrA